MHIQRPCRSIAAETEFVAAFSIAPCTCVRMLLDSVFREAWGGDGRGTGAREFDEKTTMSMTIPRAQEPWVRVKCSVPYWVRVKCSVPNYYKDCS